MVEKYKWDVGPKRAAKGRIRPNNQDQRNNLYPLPRRKTFVLLVFVDLLFNFYPFCRPHF
jgi:hypothetical protein